jgi:hypothetical protein
MAFQVWPELLPEMQGEIADRLDPYSKQVLAMGSTQLWARFGKEQENPSSLSWFSLPFNVAAFAAPVYVTNAWKFGDGSLKETDPKYANAFGLAVGEWFEGFSQRGDVELFLVYLASAFELVRERGPDFSYFLKKAVYQSNNCTFVTEAMKRYPDSMVLETFTMLDGVLSARCLEPNIDLIGLIGNLMGKEHFYGDLYDLRRWRKKGRVLVEYAKREPDFWRYVVEYEEQRRVFFVETIDYELVGQLRFWIDVRPLYTLSARARSIKKECLERGFQYEVDSPSKIAHVYRDLHPLLQELFPEHVHYTDWAFAVEEHL